MDSKTFAVVCFVAVAYFQYINTGPITPTLKLVATVDGKSYFADNSTTRTWHESEQYCVSLGMKFATINSKAQFDALIEAFDSVDFNGEYWTSGRDAQISRQFTWNTTGEELSSEYLQWTDQDILQYQTCVRYISQANSNRQGMVYWPCTETAYPLCET